MMKTIIMNAFLASKQPLHGCANANSSIWLRPAASLHRIDMKRQLAGWPGYKPKPPMSSSMFSKDGAATGTPETQAPVSVVTMCRIIQPDDANPAGNCHGGVILRLIEDAGRIATTRFAKTTTAIARIEKTDFEKPMFIGDLASLEARVLFSSGRNTMEVEVNVFGENLTTGERRLTNRARAWYVALKDDGSDIVISDKNHWGPRLVLAGSIPKFEFHSKEEEKSAFERYASKKSQRKSEIDPTWTVSGNRYKGSSPVLSYLVMPSDCAPSNQTAWGGVVMKLMDSACGVVAGRHCSTNIVTASLDALSFDSPILLGNLINVYARPTFTSNKTLEIEAHVQAEDIFTSKKWDAVSAHFTFVSLDENGKPLPMKQLPEPKTQDEAMDRKLGAARYNYRKQQRAKLNSKNGAVKP